MKRESGRCGREGGVESEGDGYVRSVSSVLCSLLVLAKLKMMVAHIYSGSIRRRDVGCKKSEGGSRVVKRRRVVSFVCDKPLPPSIPDCFTSSFDSPHIDLLSLLSLRPLARYPAEGFPLPRAPVFVCSASFFLSPVSDGADSLLSQSSRLPLPFLFSLQPSPSNHTHPHSLQLKRNDVQSPNLSRHP